MKRRLHLLLVLGFASAFAHAGERYELYNGIRALGMGGTAIAVVNDETALLYNPAALGRLRDYFITIVDPEIALGESTEQIAGTDVLKMTNPQEALNKALVNPDKHMHLRGQVFPSIVVPNFGFGIFGKYEVNSEYISATNKFKYEYNNDYAAVFGFNLRLFGGIVKLGANAKVINRIEIRRDDIAPTSTNLSIKNLAKEGMGVGSDGGLILTAPVAWLPALAAVYRDIGNTTYDFRDGMFLNTANRPETTEGSLDTAISFSPIMGKRTRSTVSFEYRDVLTLSEEDDSSRRLHAGFEINYADALFIRGGMNQRYWTTGLEVAMNNYQFQAAYYGEEIGTAAQTREDRRYVVKFSFRF